MKKIIITIILLSSLRLVAQTFQGERTFYEMPSRSAKFTTNIPAGKVIFQADSARFIRLTKYVNAGWKLDTVYKLNRYVELYSKPDTGSAGSGISYWTVSGNYIRNIDTTKYFQWYNGDGTNSAQIYGDPLYLKMEIDYPSIYGGGKVEIAPEEGRTGLYSKYGTKWAQVDLYGFFHALIPNGDEPIDLGYSSGRWGTFYGASANVSGTVTAFGGNSSNWNTAYSQRLSSASGTSPLTLTLSSNALTGSIAQAGSSSSGYLSSSDWNTFNGKQNTLTTGNLTSSDISISGGTGAVIGSGTTLSLSKGNLTETGSSILSITGGSNSVLGAGTTIQVNQSGYNSSGYLSQTDWNAFKSAVDKWAYDTGDGIVCQTANLAIGTDLAEYTLDVNGDARLNRSIILNLSPLSSPELYGEKVKLTAGENQVIGDVVFIKSFSGSAKTAICKADAIANCPYAFAMAGETISANNDGFYCLKGVMRKDTWNWTIGSLLYIKATATSGDCLTETPPTGSNNVIVPVAVALSATKIYFFGNLNTVEKN